MYGGMDDANMERLCRDSAAVSAAETSCACGGEQKLQEVCTCLLSLSFSKQSAKTFPYL